jgi:hypothetical protein
MCVLAKAKLCLRAAKTFPMIFESFSEWGAMRQKLCLSSIRLNVCSIPQCTPIKHAHLGRSLTLSMPSIINGPINARNLFWCSSNKAWVVWSSYEAAFAAVNYTLHWSMCLLVKTKVYPRPAKPWCMSCGGFSERGSIQQRLSFAFVWQSLSDHHTLHSSKGTGHRLRAAYS